MQIVLRLCFNCTGGTEKEFGQTGCANCSQLGLLGWGWFWGWISDFSPLAVRERKRSGKSERGLSKRGLGRKGANRARKGPFGGISAASRGCEVQRNQSVPISPKKAPTGPEKAPSRREIIRVIAQRTPWGWNKEGGGGKPHKGQKGDWDLHSLRAYILYAFHPLRCGCSSLSCTEIGPRLDLKMSRSRGRDEKLPSIQKTLRAQKNY